MCANMDRDLSVELFKKIEQFVCGKTAKVSIHQMRYIRLSHAKQFCNFPLFKSHVFQDFGDMKTQLRPCKKFVRIFES